MSFAHDNALYGSGLTTPLPAYDPTYGTRFNAVFSPATSPTDSVMAVAQIPATNASQHIDDQTEETAFADAVDQYMSDGGIHTTITSFADACTERSRALRTEALRFQHRAARHMHLQSEATTLEAEAATWKLLSHLYANTKQTYPAGVGGHTTAVESVHHQVAKHIANLPALLRCARVVAWLEELASNSLNYAAEQGQGPRFNETSGVWLQTQAALQSHEPQHGIVTALDPDALNRENSALTPDSTRNEAALNAYLFQLVKAGRVSEASSTCEEAGQPWRAAALQGGGSYGPIPLGPAADAQNTENLTEQLASELEANSHTAVRSLWKRTCFQVAEAAAEDGSGSSELAGQYEAALHAALCGHLQRILPVCQTKADVLWAYTRSWLELQVDVMLHQDNQNQDALLEGLQAGMDAAHALQRSNPDQPANIVLDDLADFWPPNRLVNAVPQEFEELVSVAQNSADGKEAGDMAQWQLHQDIIKQRFASLLTSFEVSKDDQAAAAAPASSHSAHLDKEKASKLRMGAHLALAVAYLPIDVPGPQDRLSIKPFQDPNVMSDGQDDGAAADDAMYQHTQEDLKMQECINRLLQQYVYLLMETPRDDLVALYCCHMADSIRRETYAYYFDSLNQRVQAGTFTPAGCRQAYHHANSRFQLWRQSPGAEGQQRPAANELDLIAEQVMQQSFWALHKGPLQWAAALRWLCCSDSTLPQAIQESNRLLRQLSLAGRPGIEAAHFLLTEVLQESPTLGAALADPSNMEALAHARPHLERDCLELNIWQQFYETEQIYSQFYQQLDSPEEEGEQDRLDQLWQLGEQYIASALQLCQTKDLQNIWERQDRSFMESEASHELQLWVVPAVDEHCSEDVQEGQLYNVVLADQMKEFVSSLQRSATACCPAGITCQVAEADDSKGVATLKLHVDHAHCKDFGEDATCLNAIIKGEQSLQVVRVEGPQSAIGALAALAAHPYVLLRAAELRQIMAEIAAEQNISFVPGQDIVETVAGTQSDSTFGLTYYFTQSELQELLECERCTQLSLLTQQQQQEHQAE